MGFLKLNRYGDTSGLVFDPDVVVQKAREAFPKIKVVPGDQLALSTDRAAVEGAADHVVQALRRNQENYGPAYAFEIPLNAGEVIQGRARRYDVSFIFPDPLPEKWHKRLFAFLTGLGPGKMEAAETADPPATGE